VIGLFYYGEYGRAAPRVILVIASALTVLSMVVAWINASYFAERLARIARATEPASGERIPTDEFDRIEQAMGNLGSALSASEAERARTDAAATARLKEEAIMLAGTVNDAIAQLDGVRLPLQILLESPFGELNENQEELLRDARSAADTIDVALRRLAQVADVDREALPVQHELVQVNDVVRSVLPLARAAAERRGARTATELEPGLPRVVGDRARLAEALSLFVTHAAEGTGPERPLTVGTARDGSHAVIRIAPADSSALGSAPALILGSRLITVQSGEVSVDDGSLVLRVGA
jgi:signal transduction histidine kinase